MLKEKLIRIIQFIYVVIFKIIRRCARRKIFNPLKCRYFEHRCWSNDVLRKVCADCTGDIINVSGWKDEDKEGSKYRDYFTKCSSYVISNYGKGARSATGPDIVTLDLEKDLPQKLEKSFDVVFNHTTLEHIFNITKAFENLCKLSRDTVILVMPFSQSVHDYGKGYMDYWRMTPFAIQRLFADNGYTLRISVGNGNQPYGSIYGLYVATRNPAKDFPAIKMFKNPLKMDFRI